MALELIAAPVLQVLSSQLSTLISREYHLLSGFNKDLEKLSKTLSTIQTVLEEAESKQIKDKRTKDWLSGLKDAAYDADDVLDELEYEALKHESEVGDHICTKQVSESLSACFDFKQIFFRRKMVKRIKQVIEKFAEIEEERSMFQLNPGVPVIVDEGVSGNRETTHILTEPKIYGRDEEKNSIIQILLDNSKNSNDLSICPIVGIGGLGKTTLAQLVYNDKEVDSQFDTRIWVSVSEDFSVKRITKMIIDHLKEKKCDLEDLSPMQNLLQKLLNGKRYLLVLDDVWYDKTGKWNEIIMFLLKCGAKGSSIIVTTRLPTVVDAITPLSPSCVINPTCNLNCLSENDSWYLFVHYAFGLRHKENENLMIIGKEIVEHCKGVPLAVKTVASLLNCDREERRWRAVRDSEIWHLEDRGDDTILPALRLSFYNLPPHFRQCFAHCAVYPKGWPMSKERLIHGWMANGLIQSCRDMEAEDVGDDIFNGLLQRSFFQELREHESETTVRYKMHDLFHELACSVMKSECTRMKIGEMDKVSQRVRHVSVTCNSASPPKTLNPLPNFKSYIRTLMFLIYETSDPSGLNLNLSFLLHLCLKHLRVLDLGFVWSLNSVPPWIGYLKLLKLLDLQKTGIVSLPEFVCGLTSLQVLLLDMNEKLTTLPTLIGKLKNLRYLGLSKTGIKGLPDSICMLSNLQTLNLEGCEQLERLPSDLNKMMSVRNLIIMDTSKLLSNGMPVGIGGMIRLEVLRVFVVNAREGAAGIQELGRLNQLKGKLTIENLKDVRDPRDAQQANLKNKYRLSELELKWSLSEDAEDEKEEKRYQVLESLEPLSNLQKLSIDGYPGVELPDWLVNCAATLPNLQQLQLTRMPNAVHDLSQLPSTLTKLWIEGCPKLRLHPDLRFPSSMESLSVEYRNDPALSSLEALPNLSKLRIVGYRQQETLICARLRNLTCLRKLWIGNCSHVKSLLPKLEHLVESLTELRVFRTADLDCITEEGLRNLASLRMLQLGGCLILKSISDSPSSLQHLRSLTTLYLGNCPELDLSAVGFQHLVFLQILQLEDLPQMTSFPNAIQHVKTLKGLFIYECKNLQMLPEWLQQRLPLSLFALEIRGCNPELHKRCERNTGEDWAKISHLKLTIRE